MWEGRGVRRGIIWEGGKESWEKAGRKTARGKRNGGNKKGEARDDNRRRQEGCSLRENQRRKDAVCESVEGKQREGERG